LADSIKKVDYLMLGNFAPAVQKSVLEQLEERPKLVVMDTMNFWMDIAMDELKAVVAQVDVLTINDEEARQLSGEYSLVKAAQVILAMGPTHLIIKKGEHGALLFHQEGMFYVPAMPLEEVFDPTGAGDSFAGGYVGYLAQTNDFSFENMKRALVYGSVVASYCVEQFGPNQLKEITEQDIKDRTNAFLELMRISLPTMV
jgi:sugar/nucleoside kinase (ribokinase family)